MIPMSIYAKRPDHKSRYRTGDIVKTNAIAYGTLTKYGPQVPLKIPTGTQGSVMEVAPFRTGRYPPSWTYKVRFWAIIGTTGEDKYWVRGNMLRLVERNPALKRKRKQHT